MDRQTREALRYPQLRLHLHHVCAAWGEHSPTKGRNPSALLQLQTHVCAHTPEPQLPPTVPSASTDSGHNAEPRHPCHRTIPRDSGAQLTHGPSLNYTPLAHTSI